VAVVLGLASAAATLALFPYLQLLIPEQLARLPARLWVVALAQSAQNGLLCTLLAWLGLTVGAPYGLGAPWFRTWLERPPRLPAIRARWLLAALYGAFAGVLVAGLSLLWPGPSGAAATGDGFSWMWRGALAAFYGGIVEEVQSRLLLVSLFVWLLARLSRRQPGAWIFVVAVLLAALLFGIGHLPAAVAAGVARTPLQGTRIVVLNMLAGTVFGSLYWKLGLEHAMVAHFCADLLLHVVLPAVSG
jgi:hypothetical protein